MVEIHLYGKLRRYAADARPDHDSVITLEARPGETVGSLLMQAGIPLDELFTVFFNAKLLSTYNRMAPWLEYRQLRDNPWDWDLSVPVRDGDRLGLFSRDMASLVV